MKGSIRPSINRQSRIGSIIQAGNPAGDTGTILLVFFPEFSVQRRLFVKNDKRKKSHPDDEPVLDHTDAPEEKSLAKDQQQHGNIHWVAHVAIKSSRYQTLRGSDGRRCPQPLDRESRKGIKQDRKSGRHHHRPEDAEWEKAKQRWGEAPGTKCPWDIHSQRSRSNNQEDRGTEDGAGTFHDGP